MKFRLWDKENKDWIKSYNVAIDGEGWTLTFMYGVQGGISCSIQHDNDKFIIQYFTGLRDKNGIYIYEGDIIRDNQGGVTIISNKEFSCGCCGYVYGYAVPGRLNDNICDCEVIGNVCENKENGDILEKK